MRPARHLDARTSVQTTIVALDHDLLHQHPVREHEAVQRSQMIVELDHVAVLGRPVIQLEEVVAEVLEDHPPRRIQTEARVEM